jgi:hypothetical protein
MRKQGAITLRPWVNKGNKILPCALRSNHDISVIANWSHMLASFYYMSSYSTKDDDIYLEVGIGERT